MKILQITLTYEVPDGAFAEKHATDVISEVYDYANKWLKSVAIDFEKSATVPIPCVAALQELAGNAGPSFGGPHTRGDAPIARDKSAVFEASRRHASEDDEDD